MKRVAQRIAQWMHGAGVVRGGRPYLGPIQFLSDDRTVQLVALTLGNLDLWGYASVGYLM